MGSSEFLALCRTKLREYVNEYLDKTDTVGNVDIYVVWSCKTLQHNKALLSTTLPDGMYYEFTYNGDKDELYLDAYMKFENRCIKVKEV